MTLCHKCGVEEVPAKRLARCDYRCRSCYNRYSAEIRRRQRENPDAQPQKRSAWNISPEKRAERNAKAYQKRFTNPIDRQKLKARSSLRYAVSVGKVVKLPCEVCGEVKVEAHHDDYSKPYDVRWLCKFHHYELHRQLRQNQKVAA